MARAARNSTPSPDIIDPATLPTGQYAITVAGDCMLPAIADGTPVLVDPDAPIRTGDLAIFYFRPAFIGPRAVTNAFLKRIVHPIDQRVNLPYTPHPGDDVMPVAIVEQDHPRRRYVVPVDQLLGMHRCLGPVPEGIALAPPEGVRAAAGGMLDRDEIALADELGEIAAQVSVVDAAVEGLDSTDWATTVPGLRALLLNLRHRVEAVRDTIHPPAKEDDDNRPETAAAAAPADDDEGRGSPANLSADPDADLEYTLLDLRGLAKALIFMPDEAGIGPAVHAIGRKIGDMAENADELRVRIGRN